MKNKGFTLVELLAVIVILGILSSLALIGVTRYRQKVNEKELVNLHSTIEAAYDKYRSDLLMSGGNPKTDFEVSDNNENKTVFNKYFSEFSYSGSILTKEELKGSTFAIKVKGALIGDTNYMNDNLGNINQAYLDDGICIPESSPNTQESVETSISNSCKLEEDNTPIPSKEEILCIKLLRNNEVLINDYDKDKSMQPLCVYFANSENADVEEAIPNE